MLVKMEFNSRGIHFGKGRKTFPLKSITWKVFVIGGRRDLRLVAPPRIMAAIAVSLCPLEIINWIYDISLQTDTVSTIQL